VLSTGLQILVVVDQLTGQQTKELVAGAPTFRTPAAGNLIAKSLYEHIVPRVFFSTTCLFHRQYEYKYACSSK